jgi:hypothetical protein
MRSCTAKGVRLGLERDDIVVNRLRRKFDPTDKWMETKAQVEKVVDDGRKINQVVARGSYGPEAARLWACPERVSTIWRARMAYRRWRSNESGKPHRPQRRLQRPQRHCCWRYGEIDWAPQQ